MEGLSQHLDELAEIDTTVGNVVEDSLAAVALVFHIANLHLQAQVGSNLARLNHRLMLAALSLGILLHINGTCLAIDAAHGSILLYAYLLHLQQHQPPSEGDGADIVSRAGLDSHDVTLVKVKVIAIEVVALAGVLELDFDVVRLLQVAGGIGKVVIDVKGAVLTTITAAANAVVGKI